LQCRVRAMDPFNPVAQSGESGGFLFASQVEGSSTSFSLDLPNLRQWRKDGLQVELRMIRISDTKVCHVWPNKLKFSVNHKQVFRIVEPEEGHKRRDIPQVVTPGLAPGRNLVDIEMSDVLLHGFSFAVVLTSTLEPPQLAKEVRRCKLSESQTRVKAVLAKLQGQGASTDEDLMCLTTNKLKVLCPLTMERVEEPVRGEHCQHLQCFSLSAYLSSNRKMSAFNNRWVCPLCSLILQPKDLRVDSFVESILQATAEDIEEVNILPDGTWTSSSSSTAAAPSQAPVRSGDDCGASSAMAVDSDDEDMLMAAATSDDDVPLSALSAPCGAMMMQPATSARPTAGTKGKAPAPKLKRHVAPLSSGQKRQAPVASPARKPFSGSNGQKRRCLKGASEAEADTLNLGDRLVNAAVGVPSSAGDDAVVCLD